MIVALRLLPKFNNINVHFQVLSIDDNVEKIMSALALCLQIQRYIQ